MRLLLVLLLAGCSVDSTGLLPMEDSGPGVDGGPRVDGGPTVDGGPGGDTGPGVDGGPTVDGGPGVDTGPIFDGGPPRDVPLDVFDAGNDAGCLERCDGSTYVHCTDGMTMRSDCAFECLSGAEAFAGTGCYDLDPTNLDDPMSDVPGTGRPTIIDGNELWTTNECSTIPGYWKVVSQPSARALCVLAFGDIEFRGDVRVVGNRPLLIVSTGTVTISGSLRTDAEGATPGAGGGRGGVVGVDVRGSRPGSPGLNTGVGDYTDGGGGGGGSRYPGGAGGNAGGLRGSASTGAAAGGRMFGGGYMGSPLRGGSGGGVGGAGESAGNGGAGGGAIQISARFAIEITASGVVDLGGGGGGGGGDGTPSDDNIGGGGGSGGVFFLESADSIGIDGGIFAPGGGGGGAAGCLSSGDAGSGQEISPGDVAGGVSGNACVAFFGANGGRGGVGGQGAGGASNDEPGANGGGGGGGGGLLLLRSPTDLGQGRESRPNLVRVD